MHRPTRRRRQAGHKPSERGQSLVEFALVFPIFFAMLIGLIEFSFMFNAVLSVSMASRDAAVIAAEASDSPDADCSILLSIERSFGAPADVASVARVDIYWTDANGSAKGATNSYVRGGGSIACATKSGSVNLPYSQTANGYPNDVRCTDRAGCGNGHTGLDTIGVKITYHYDYKTPYGAAFAGGLTLERSSEMRVEPFQ